MEVPTSEGVYQIRCAPGGMPIRVNRIMGPDPDGILYIGQSERLRSRIRTFWRAAKSDIRSTRTPHPPHSGGITYAVCRYAEKFPLDGLQVRWAQVKDSKHIEGGLLAWYVEKFIDGPPLNLNLNRKYYSLG